MNRCLQKPNAIEALANKSQFKLLRSENLKEILETSRQQIEKANEEIKETQTIMHKLEESTEKIASEALEKHVTLALLEFKRANGINEMKTIEKQLREAEENLNIIILKAQQSGERIAVLKSNSEIQDEIGLTRRSPGSAIRRIRRY